MSGNPMLGRWARLYKGTPAERALEPAVAALGVPYRTQYPLFLFGPLRYFPDFVLLEQRVILEVDDPSHGTRVKQAADEVRSAALTRAGYRVARCTNEDALRYPFATVNRMMRQLGLTLTAEPPPSTAAAGAAQQETP